MDADRRNIVYKDDLGHSLQFKTFEEGNQTEDLYERYEDDIHFTNVSKLKTELRMTKPSGEASRKNLSWCWQACISQDESSLLIIYSNFLFAWIYSYKFDDDDKLV